MLSALTTFIYFGSWYRPIIFLFRSKRETSIYCKLRAHRHVDGEEKEIEIWNPISTTFAGYISDAKLLVNQIN